MNKWGIAVALSSGVVVSAILLLLLNFGSTLLVASVLLLPGGILSAFVSRTPEYSPTALFLTNAFVYAIPVWLVVAFFRKSSTSLLRRIAMSVGVVAVIFTCLIFFRSLNRTWPRGMDKLTENERRIQDVLPLGIDVEQAHAILHSNEIGFDEETEAGSSVILSTEDRSITASAGDRVVFGRVHTQAGQFPCKYDLKVVLVFGQDQRLKDRYVHRQRICP